MSESHREARELWAITDWGTVELVTGYDCKPNSPEYWWVPRLGYSMSLGVSVFPIDRKKQALEKAVAQQKAARNQAQERLDALEHQLAREI